jgi:hypothetical protein
LLVEPIEKAGEDIIDREERRIAKAGLDRLNRHPQEGVYSPLEDATVRHIVLSDVDGDFLAALIAQVPGVILRGSGHSWNLEDVLFSRVSWVDQLNKIAGDLYFDYFGSHNGVTEGDIGLQVEAIYSGRIFMTAIGHNRTRYLRGLEQERLLKVLTEGILREDLTAKAAQNILTC